MKISILLLLSAFCVPLLLSQSNSYNFSSSSGTFTAISGGTVLGTTANDDEVFNNNTSGETGTQTDIGFPIGFDFSYNGTIFDRFAVNTNGWIKLGSGTFTIGNTYTPISYSGTSGFENIFSALGRDLQGQTGSELSYLLTGSSPNRVLVIQWLNYRKYNASSGESYDFQIRLNESSSSVTFVYGDVTTANTSTSTSNNPTQVGIRGLSNSDYRNRSTTSSWSSSSNGSSNTSTMRLTTSVKPSSGLTYTFAPGNMSYSSCNTYIADTSSVKKGSVNNPVIRIQVVVNGLLNPLSVTSISCKTNGTSNTSDITNARIWYTGTSSVFSAANQFGNVISNPSGTINFNDTRALSSGTNYFWLTYDVPLTAITGNSIDGECSSVTVGSSRTPSTQAPSGNRKIANNPLTGTYSVGLAMFNLISGKNLHYQKIEKPVLITKYTRDVFRNGKTQSKLDENEIFQNLSASEFSSTGDTFILMDGSVQYTSPGYIEITPELRNRFGRSLLGDEINGIYSSLTAAVNDLGSRGIQGPVLFSLVDELYSTETFPISLNSIYGTSGVNTVTIKPASGVSPQIVMSTGTAVFRIFNSNNIIIDGSNIVNGSSRDLSIISNNSGISNCVWVGSSGTNPVSNVSIKNCNIKSGESSLGSSSIMVSDGSVAGNAGYFSDIMILNNFIQKGRQGIYLNGGIDPQNGSNIYIYDNVISSSGADATGYLGIYMQGVNNSVIRGNEVGNLNNTANEDDKAIWVANGSHGVTVERNKIYNIGYSGSNGQGGHGIYVSSNHLNADVTLKNNLIYSIYGDGWNHNDAAYFLDNPAGIMLYSSTPQSGISIFNNSINLYGNTLNKVSSLSSGIFLTSGTIADIRNNSIVNNLGVISDSAFGSCAVFAQSDASQFLNINYNNYYVAPAGNGVKAIGKISGSASLTLQQWITATGKDRSSLNYNPGFTSNEDLNPDINNSDSWSLNGRGTQITSVNNDYAGNVRSTTLAGGAPDIGAYEFTPSAEPHAMIQSGSISDGGTTLFMFAGDTVAAVSWHGNNLPVSVSAKYFSGANPPLATTGKFGNSYILFAPQGGLGYTFDIKLYYDPALTGTISDENRISMANYVNSEWTHYDTELDITLRTVYKTGLADLTLFAIDDYDYPMPVQLESFNASVSGRNVTLNWKTGFEINNAGFEIERRSEFDAEWKKTGYVQGNGTKNSESFYSYIDQNLNTAKYSYRLKQVNYNNSFEYFALNSDVTVGKPAKYDVSQNYPNPSNPSSQINFQVPSDANVTLKVYDIQGREVKTLISSYLAAGYYTAEFDGTEIASGIYFYRLSVENFSKTLKLILIK